MKYKKSASTILCSKPKIQHERCINSDCDYIGPKILDTTNGCYLCSSCGAVLSRSLNITPEFMSAPNIDYRRTGTSLNVSQTVQNMCTAQVAPSYFNDLEHMNGFANLTTDQLRYADELMTSIPWKRSTTIKSRLIALLLEPRLMAFDVSEFRQNIEKKKINKEINPTPKATHRCIQCNVFCHSVKEAKYHCKCPI